MLKIIIEGVVEGKNVRKQMQQPMQQANSLRIID
jgi:hypothetical protein